MTVRPTIRVPRALTGSFAIGALALASVAACSSDAPSDGATSTTILLSDTFDSLDPALASTPAARQVTSFLYDPLVHYDDATGEITSGLAESWTFGPTSAELVLKDGVTCSDGTPLTAATVARNLDRAKDPEVNAPLTTNFLGTLDYSVTADETSRTVSIELATPYPFLARGLSLGPLMVCDSGLDDASTLTSTVSGSGPYTVKEIVPGERYVLSLREGYTWGDGGATTATQGLPTEVTFTLVKDENTAANLMLSGTGDAAQLSPQVLGRFSGETGTTTIADMPSTYFLNYNQRAGHVTADQAVRSMLAQSVDAAQFTKVQGQGAGVVATTLRAPDAVCSAPAATEDLVLGFDQSAAAATLTAAGWAKGTDGTWAKDGQPLVVRVLQMDTSASAVEYLRDAWTSFGLTVEVDSTPSSQATSALFGGESWDVALVSISAATPTGIRFFVSGPESPEGANYSAISNADYDAAAAQAMELTGDPSCEKWVVGEQALFTATDLMPLASIGSSWVLDGLTFELMNSSIQPLSLRVG